jgi:hypothetical protein
MKKFRYTFLRRCEDGTLTTTEVEVEAEDWNTLGNGTLAFYNKEKETIHLVQPNDWQSVWVV